MDERNIVRMPLRPVPERQKRAIFALRELIPELHAGVFPGNPNGLLTEVVCETMGALEDMALAGVPQARQCLDLCEAVLDALGDLAAAEDTGARH